MTTRAETIGEREFVPMVWYAPRSGRGPKRLYGGLYSAARSLRVSYIPDGPEGPLIRRVKSCSPDEWLRWAGDRLDPADA